MLCPHCNAEIADDAAICSFCDAILDDAFLDADGPTAPQSLAAPPPPVAAQAPVPFVAEPPPLYDEPQSLEKQATGGASDGTSILRMDPEQHKETRIVNFNELSARRNPSERAALSTRNPAEATESQLDDFWGQIGLAFRRLRPLDKVVLVTLGALILGAFLPWYSPQGRASISGIEANGWMTATLAGAALVAFWVRVSLRIVLLVLVQVGLIVGASLVAGYAMLHPGTKTVSFGIYFTLLSGGAAAVLSLVAAVKT